VERIHGLGTSQSLKAGYLARVLVYFAVSIQNSRVFQRKFFTSDWGKEKIGTAGVSSSTLDPGHIPATVE
jgi:hypothetical protein